MVPAFPTKERAAPRLELEEPGPVVATLRDRELYPPLSDNKK